PYLRARADVLVVERVRRFARPRHADHLLRVSAPGNVVADQAEQFALALVDVHRNDFFREAVVLADEAEMQLADRRDAVPGLAQQALPRGYRPVTRNGVVPVADLVDVLAAGEARPRRDADRTRGVCGTEARAACGERVEVRRVDPRAGGGNQ